MTQTSKTSWGAKYSAKRITNTCKTPDEAAHAYDQYLKTYYPQKYSKFANFCEKCGRFVNPLGLPEYKSECDCTSLHASTAESPSGGSSGSIESPKKEVMMTMAEARNQITTPTASAPTNPPTAPSPVGGPIANPADDQDGNLRASNLSVGSLKFSLSDDNDDFFAESLNDVAKMAAGAGVFGDELDQTSATPLTKRDSLPMAVISSAGDSFTNEDNLDQIISDINRSSTSSFQKHPSFSTMAAPMVIDPTHDDKNTALDMLNNIEPTSTSGSSTFVDFSPEELQDLSEYFLSDNDAAAVVQQQMKLMPVVDGMSGVDGSAAPSERHGPLKKMHSLDFSDDGMGSQRSQRSVVKEEIAMMDVDAIASSFLQASVVPVIPVTSTATTATAFPARIEIQTPFLEKYWRNDRKNIQCFPYCPEHGDYYRVRIENLQHRCKGVCRAAVKAQITMPIVENLTLSNLLVLSRCNSTFSRNATTSTQPSLNLSEMKTLQAVSAVGVIDNFVSIEGGQGVQFDVTFYPDVWKFEFDLPKKRRHIQNASSAAVADDLDNPGAEFLYFFEIDVFFSTDKTVFQRMGHCESVNFQIGNTRTLLRQRNKMTDATTSTPRNDGDRVLEAEGLPEKKKIKYVIARREFALSTTSMNEDITADASVAENSGKEPLAAKYITGESLSSSSKKQLLANSEPVDLDAYCRTDSKDSIFNAEARSSDLPKVKTEVWKDNETDDDAQDSGANYNPYISPKQTAVMVDGSGVGTKPATKASSQPHHTPPELQSSDLPESYSLPKMFGYALACLPLSVVFLPIGLVLLLAFVLLPPVAPSVVKTLDALSDLELSRANSSLIQSDKRYVLDPLQGESGDALAGEKKKPGMFRYHGNGAVWSRFAYLCGGKLVISVVAVCPTLPFALFAALLFPIRPASRAMSQAACSCVLWTREYTRHTTGKPHPTAPYDVQAQLV